ncbi:hypothetical protein Tco_1253122 [Tanacetum coccineum]
MGCRGASGVVSGLDVSMWVVVWDGVGSFVCMLSGFRLEQVWVCLVLWFLNCEGVGSALWIDSVWRGVGIVDCLFLVGWLCVGCVGAIVDCGFRRWMSSLVDVGLLEGVGLGVFWAALRAVLYVDFLGSGYGSGDGVVWVSGDGLGVIQCVELYLFFVSGGWYLGLQGGCRVPDGGYICSSSFGVVVVGGGSGGFSVGDVGGGVMCGIEVGWCSNWGGFSTLGVAWVNGLATVIRVCGLCRFSLGSFCLFFVVVDGGAPAYAYWGDGSVGRGFWSWMCCDVCLGGECVGAKECVHWGWGFVEFVILAALFCSRCCVVVGGGWGELAGRLGLGGGVGCVWTWWIRGCEWGFGCGGVGVVESWYVRGCMVLVNGLVGKCVIGVSSFMEGLLVCMRLGVDVMCADGLIGWVVGFDVGGLICRYIVWGSALLMVLVAGSRCWGFGLLLARVVTDSVGWHWVCGKDVGVVVEGVVRAVLWWGSMTLVASPQPLGRMDGRCDAFGWGLWVRGDVVEGGGYVLSGCGIYLGCLGWWCLVVFVYGLWSSVYGVVGCGFNGWRVGCVWMLLSLDGVDGFVAVVFGVRCRGLFVRFLIGYVVVDLFVGQGFWVGAIGCVSGILLVVGGIEVGFADVFD